MQASDAMYSRIVEAVPEGIWIADPQGRTLFCNLRMAELLRTDIDTLRQGTCFDCVYPEDLADAQRQFADQMAGGPPFDFRLRRGDGSPVWVRISCSPMLDEAGAVVGLLGLFTDITERKKAEAALREAEQRFRAMLSQASVGIAQAALDGECLFVNDRYCEIVRYTREELLGKTVLDITHPDDRESTRAGIRRLAEGGEPPPVVEKRYVRRDGATVWARLFVSVHRDENNRPQYLTVVVEDITEQRQAEAALRESEERFRNMADTAPVMIWTSDTTRQVTFCNRQKLRFTGKTMDELVGENWRASVHPEDREHCWARYSSAFDLRQDFQMEYRLQAADGEYRWVLTTGSPRFDSSGAFRGYIGTTIDTTELRRARDEDLARRKLEGLGLIAAGIAHDFNNLLGGILAEAEAASETASGPMRESIGSITAIATRASEIVRELMIYAGKETATLAPLDLSILVEEMLYLLKLAISRHAVLQVDLGWNLPAVRANAAQLRQVVMNLITNASEAFGENHGVIHVSTARVMLPAGEHLRLEVSDTGCGMTPEAQSLAFDPFFTTEFAGRGLGLSLVHRIVHDHRGTIQLESAPGRGTRVQVFLPSTGEPLPGRGASAEPVARVSRPAGVVLVVEDEDPLRIALAKLLRRKGFFAIEAKNGSAAIEFLRAGTNHIDLVLLDATTPGLAATEVIAEAHRIRPDLKIIVTSAYTREMAIPAVDAAQIHGFIRKPFRFNEVLELLGETLT
jgi:two-component system, cell cycle sensor histidine kinase and response regulator CckA